jgi:hypothetical protein
MGCMNGRIMPAKIAKIKKPAKAPVSGGLGRRGLPGQVSATTARSLA